VLPDIKSLTREELESQFKTTGEPAYRVAQLLDWLYARRAANRVETCQPIEKS
jgi:adenine C2-methylase RlmN of 23S rRNA A2503 and tRNA A37